MEYLDTLCCRVVEPGEGSWNVEQPGSELQLIQLGEPAQPQHSWYLWHSISPSSLLVTCFTCLCTEMQLVFKVCELGSFAAVKQLNCIQTWLILEAVCPVTLKLAASVWEGCFTL